MAKLLLDNDEMVKDFFEDSAMIGIVSAQPGYRFCWLINNHFDINFVRDPALNISLQKKDKEKKAVTYLFPIYQYDIPNSTHKYLLYKLKTSSVFLLPERRQMDYLWLIKTTDPGNDAHRIIQELRNIPDVQLAQIIGLGDLKNPDNLLV